MTEYIICDILTQTRWNILCLLGLTFETPVKSNRRGYKNAKTKTIYTLYKK